MSEIQRVKLANGQTIEVPLGEAFLITSQLRWAVPSHATTKPPRLQQLYQGMRGTQRWEDVPTVVVEGFTP